MALLLRFKLFHHSEELMLPMEGIYSSICFIGKKIDKKTSDLYDWVGAGICLIGVSVMLFAPRQ